MRETLLNYLFGLISRFRVVEINLLTAGRPEEAEKVRQTNRELSIYRDRLITSKLTESTAGLREAELQLEAVAGDLTEYLGLKESATRKLEAVLEKLPAVLSLLHGLTA